MLRRIELINQNSELGKSGLMACSPSEVIRAWNMLNSPRRQLYKNCRFYFTEEGWRRYGRATVAACQKTGQQYRVIRVKERSVDVMYRDECQVAVRARKGQNYLKALQ
ncbi:MAG: hypothetical protein E8D42_06865 [Nitrospira sp.]|nr:MAG: hypothetical protein E8D42_06865 [Nitrospira sp.]